MPKYYPGKYSTDLSNHIIDYLGYQADKELEYAKPEQLEVVKKAADTLKEIALQCRDINPIVFAIARMKRKDKILRIDKETGEKKYIKVWKKEIFPPGNSGRLTLLDKGRIAWTKDEIIQENNHEYFYKP